MNQSNYKQYFIIHLLVSNNQHQKTQCEYAEKLSFGFTTNQHLFVTFRWDLLEVEKGGPTPTRNIPRDIPKGVLTIMILQTCHQPFISEPLVNVFQHHLNTHFISSDPPSWGHSPERKHHYLTSLWFGQWKKYLYVLPPPPQQKASYQLLKATQHGLKTLHPQKKSDQICHLVGGWTTRVKNMSQNGFIFRKDRG